MAEIFALETAHTGLYFARRGPLAELLHYGRRIHPDAACLQEKLAAAYGTDVMYGDTGISLTHLCLPVTPPDKGDVRRGALEIQWADGSRAAEWSFAGAAKQAAPLPPEGLPAAFGGAETLVLRYTCPRGAELRLIFTAYPDCDAITARMAVANTGDAPFLLCRALSYQLDLPGTGWELTTLTGAWARERHPASRRLAPGTAVFGSGTGVSSHYCSPAFLLCGPGANEDAGPVYGFDLIYSGSHYGSVETGPYAKTRVMAGIQPDGFGWTLAPGQAFDTPEAVWVFSACGKNAMSQNRHRFVQNHIVRGPWAHRPRPVLLNNWEATYFDFTQPALLRLAKQAKALGIELFVLDDGWFGRRDSDTCSLGDYTVNTQKLPGGLAGLAEKINGMGLDFGLWMEPEMVSPDSELYRAHPDWAVQTPAGAPALCRNQLVLDLCRTEVQDYIIEQVTATLQSAPVTYVKWDMNRPLTDCYSPALPEQGRFAHAWVQGLYRVLDALSRAFPEILFEGCASGGNRFDLGILCYMPQIWVSDDTDAWERMLIQEGTSYGFPPSVMGCHVSAAPNHQTLRRSPLETRFDVAAFGVLGYELDLTQCTPAEKKAVAEQVAFYKRHRELFQFGRFYRLQSPFSGESCCWMVVAEDRRRALVLEAIGRVQPNAETPPLYLKGLDPDVCYRVTSRPQGNDVRDFGSLIGQALPVRVNSGGVLVHLAAERYMLPTETESYTAYGDLLMYAGLRPFQRFDGTGYNDQVRMMPDYGARLWELQALDDAGQPGG